jgi:hypothetical protein
MININKSDKIRIYNDGVLIIEGNCYNDIKSTVEKAKKIIQDAYQINILTQILIEIREVA